MITLLLVSVRGLVPRLALQIMLGAAFAAGQIAVQAIAAVHAPVAGHVLPPQAAAAPEAGTPSAGHAPTPANAADETAAPAVVGPGWG